MTAAISGVFGPETRTMPTLPRPGGVALATIVSVRVMFHLPLNKGYGESDTHASYDFFFFSASMRRLMFHCWAIDSTVFVTQYSTRPDGKNANMTDIANGMIMNTFCWTG